MSNIIGKIEEKLHVGGHKTGTAPGATTGTGIGGGHHVGGTNPLTGGVGGGTNPITGGVGGGHHTNPLTGGVGGGTNPLTGGVGGGHHTNPLTGGVGGTNPVTGGVGGGTHVGHQGPLDKVKQKVEQGKAKILPNKGGATY